MKKLLAIVISVVMVLAIVPMSVFATEPTSGTCGANLTWTLNEETGELAISGNGAIDHYSEATPAPWAEYRAQIKKITIGSGVSKIGNETFRDCVNLEEVSIPEGVAKIGNTAFQGCTSLKEVTIPSSVTTLEHHAFAGCTGLTEIDLGDGMQAVGKHAFRECTGIRVVTIPATLASVADNAFYGCSALKYAISEGTEEQWKAVTIGYGNDILKSATIRFGIVKGDADGNGKINSTDALVCLHQTVGNSDYSGEWLKSMDVNGDGKVNSYDALRIMKFTVGSIEEL